MSPNSAGAVKLTAMRLLNGQAASALAYLRWVVGADGSVTGIERIRSSIVVDHLLPSIQPAGQVAGPVRSRSPAGAGLCPTASADVQERVPC